MSDDDRAYVLVNSPRVPLTAAFSFVPGRPGGHWADVERARDAEQQAGVVVLRPEGGLFFANADHVAAAIRAAAERDGITTVVLDAETVAFVDITAARMLADLRRDLASRGLRLEVARDVGQVRDMLAVTEREKVAQ